MSVIIRVHLVLFITLSIVLIVSCYKEGYNWPPDEVSYLKAEPGNGCILLTWQDPESPDLDRILVSYRDTIVHIAPGIEQYMVKNLANDTIHRFVVRTIDQQGNRSYGRHAHGKPVAPPEIEWLDQPTTVMDTNYLGDLNGGFITTRTFRCLGGTGYIDFHINTVRLADDTVVLTYEKRFLVTEMTTYRFELTARGDITIFNCTECSGENATYQAEIISIADNEIFTVSPSSCIQVPLCSNGKSKKETRWNMISVKHLNLLKE